MKKRILVLLFFSVFCLSGCEVNRKIPREKNQSTTYIDKKIVQKMVGSWHDVENQKNYRFALTNKQLEMTIGNKVERLDVTSTENLSVYTKKQAKKMDFYHFIVNDSKIKMVQSRPNKNGATEQLDAIELTKLYSKELTVNTLNQSDYQKYDEELAHLYQLYEEKQPFDVTFNHFTIEGDPIKIHLSYDTKELYYRHDGSQDKFGSGEIERYSFDKLESVKGKSGLVNEYVLSNHSEKAVPKKLSLVSLSQGEGNY